LSLFERLSPFLWLACCGACASATSAPGAARVPEASVLNLDGSRTSLRQVLGGRVAVIDFWATWCEACEKEHVKLVRLAAAYTRSRLLVVALNVGEEPARVAEYVQRHQLTYPVYLDPEFRVAQSFSETKLPALLIIAPNGRVVHRGSALDREALRQIQTLLRKSPEPMSAP
jgi:thiol-disulfide isomerase/thioredoxin